MGGEARNAPASIARPPPPVPSLLFLSGVTTHKEAFRRTFLLFIQLNATALACALLAAAIVFAVAASAHNALLALPGMADGQLVGPYDRVLEPSLFSPGWAALKSLPTYWLLRWLWGFSTTLFVICGIAPIYVYAIWREKAPMRTILRRVFLPSAVLLACWAAQIALYTGGVIYVPTAYPSMVNILVFLINSIVTGFTVATAFGQKELRWAVPVPIVLVGVISYLFFQFFPLLWTSTSNTGRVLLRLVLQPLIFEVVFVFSRACARLYTSAEPRRLVFVLLGAQMIYSMYGRFLLVTMGSTLVTVLATIGLALQELVLRLTVRQRDWVVYRLLRNSSERTKSILNSPSSRMLRSSVICSEIIIENLSIVLSTVIILANRLTLVENEELVVSSILLSGLFQLALEIIVDYICVHVELKAFQLPVLRVWRMRGAFFFTAMLLVYTALLIIFFWIGQLMPLMCVRGNDGKLSFFYCTAENYDDFERY